MIKKADMTSITILHIEYDVLRRALLPALIMLFAGLLFTSCEKNNDLNPEFPADEFLGTGSWEGEYWPTTRWKSCAPGEVGMDAGLLGMMNDDLVLQKKLHHDVHSVLVIRKGYIIAEQYYSPDFGPDSLHYLYSCTKSITSAAFGIARHKGYFPSLNRSLLEYFQDYNVQNAYGKEMITLKHALTMSDGLEWWELKYPYGHEQNTFSKWRREAEGSVEFVLGLPMKEIPGSTFNYNSGVSHLLSIVLERETGMRLDSFVHRELFNPLGINNYKWSINQDGAAKGYSGLYLRPRDLAKIGLLFLRDGLWENNQIIPQSYVTESTDTHIFRDDDTGFYYGYQWWVHEGGLYAAVGYGGQIMMVIPDEELVVVFTNYYDETEPFQIQSPWRLLDSFILPAIRD